ncbi:MAG: dihydrodipicolinate synthase family protein [Gemmatimonadales bacterium]|nr:dihydrodipicolinate synthase family protein [Gemmatimonadales bacterium]
MPPELIVRRLREGMVIPAHPLALTRGRRLDERRQRALTRYYLAAGAGGVAVGVHTTQFEIHDAKIGLFQPVLELCAEAIAEARPPRHRVAVRVAGVSGPTRQAVREARMASDLGYHAALVSFAGLRRAPVERLLAHARAVAQVMPIIGFYLQPVVGGRVLPRQFWHGLLKIDNLIAIKVAPFSRYETLEVVRAVWESGRAGEVALYTGNDDHIILDLLTTYRFAPRQPPLRMAGGLLGQWAVWTRKAVAHFRKCRDVHAAPGTHIPRSLTTLAEQLTEANGAIFDARNQFRGCLPGIHEVLRRQGLLRGRWCLDPALELSPGQAAEIDRVYRAYPQLHDDNFVATHLDAWLR